MKDPRVNGDDFFDRWHEEGDQVFTILLESCEVPPSCEVFEHGLEKARERARIPVSVLRYAGFLADKYHRIT